MVLDAMFKRYIYFNKLCLSNTSIQSFWLHPKKALIFGSQLSKKFEKCSLTLLGGMSLSYFADKVRSKLVKIYGFKNKMCKFFDCLWRKNTHPFLTHYSIG